MQKKSEKWEGLGLAWLTQRKQSAPPLDMEKQLSDSIPKSESHPGAGVVQRTTHTTIAHYTPSKTSYSMRDVSVQPLGGKPLARLCLDRRKVPSPPPLPASSSLDSDEESSNELDEDEDLLVLFGASGLSETNILRAQEQAERETHLERMNAIREKKIELGQDRTRHDIKAAKGDFEEKIERSLRQTHQRAGHSNPELGASQAEEMRAARAFCNEWKHQFEQSMLDEISCLEHDLHVANQRMNTVLHEMVLPNKNLARERGWELHPNEKTQSVV